MVQGNPCIGIMFVLLSSMKMRKQKEESLLMGN